MNPPCYTPSFPFSPCLQAGHADSELRFCPPPGLSEGNCWQVTLASCMQGKNQSPRSKREGWQIDDGDSNEIPFAPASGISKIQSSRFRLFAAFVQILSCTVTVSPSAGESRPRLAWSSGRSSIAPMLEPSARRSAILCQLKWTFPLAMVAAFTFFR
jgi:hypothetical protein